MTDDQQNIQNDAPNQGAQGQFHGTVNIFGSLTSAVAIVAVVAIATVGLLISRNTIISSEHSSQIPSNPTYSPPEEPGLTLANNEPSIPQETATSLNPSPIVVVNENNGTNRELQAAWDNSRLLSVDDISTGIEILEQTEAHLTLQIRGEAEKTSPYWMISSKRVALEHAAAYISSIVSNPNTAEYYFIRGEITNADFDSADKSVTILFELELPGE
jgi:hypothetical protein